MCKNTISIDKMKVKMTIHYSNGQIEQEEYDDQIKELNLHYVQITEIIEPNLLTNLQALFLERNQITEIRGLDVLTNLQTLYLCNN